MENVLKSRLWGRPGNLKRPCIYDPDEGQGQSIQSEYLIHVFMGGGLCHRVVGSSPTSSSE